MNASKAVDGLKTDLSSSGHQCTLSANFKDQALFSVDLGSVFGIHHITIYYRTDNVPWGPSHDYAVRFLGFSVYISNTTKKEDGVLCFKDNQHFTKYTIPPVLTLNCTHHGRYAIYYNNRTSSNLPPDYSQYAYNELCEFEVYAIGLSFHKVWLFKSLPFLRSRGDKLFVARKETDELKHYGKKDHSSNLVLQKSDMQSLCKGTDKKYHVRNLISIHPTMECICLRKHCFTQKCLAATSLRRSDL
eukprot:XP_019929321.1 PREDICTED: uncharacterized protein LOC105344437 [Crassostrea gigas]